MSLKMSLMVILAPKLMVMLICMIFFWWDYLLKKVAKSIWTGPPPPPNLGNPQKKGYFIWDGLSLWSTVISEDPSLH